MPAFHLALKDLRLLSRDRMALFWTCVFPIAFAIFIGSVLSASLSRESAKLPLVLVDEARTQASASLRDALGKSAGLSLSHEDDLETARQQVQRAERVAYLRAPRGFGSDPNVGLELGADPSRAAEASLLRASIGSSLDRGTGPRLEQLEVATGKRPRSGWELVFPAAILWGLMGCAATFAVGMVAERAQGTFIRLRAAPISRATVLAGKALAATLACTIDAAALLAIARWGFGVKPDSYVLLSLALGSVIVCFVGLTLLLSTLGRTEQGVSGGGWATLLFMAMLGGAMVPVSLMPAWLQSASHVSPVKWSILALEGAIWRGSTLTELAAPCGILIAGGALAFLAGIARSARADAAVGV